MVLIDATLNDSFGQRQVSTIYNPLNQYRVVMEVAPPYWQSPEALRDLYISVPSNAQFPGGAQVPLLAFASYGLNNTPFASQSPGQFAASTISFNLPPGISLSEATKAISGHDAPHRMCRAPSGAASRGRPGISGVPAKPALADPRPLCSRSHIVLGILYESLCPFRSPFISTLPDPPVSGPSWP